MKTSIIASLFLLCAIPFIGAQEAANVSPDAGLKRDSVELVGTQNVAAALPNYPKNTFELDLAIGTSTKAWSPGLNVGIGWLHNYSRYFAWDILRFQMANSFENFEAKNTEISLLTGPKIYFKPVTEQIVPFFAFRVGATTNLNNAFDNIGVCISPEIGVNLSRSFYIALGYSHSWSSYTTEWTETGTERYKIGSHQLWNGGPWVDDYTTRPYSRKHSETTKISAGNLYLRLGFNF